MQQRYDISVDADKDRLSIKEYTILERPGRMQSNVDNAQLEYSLIHEETYDGDVIRAAIDEGKEALIAALRTDNFYPIQSSAEHIAEKVIGVFDNTSDSMVKLYTDDMALLASDD